MALKDSKLEEKEQLVIKGTIFADEFRNRQTGSRIEENTPVVDSPKRYYVDNIKAIPGELLEKLACGDVVVKHTVESSKDLYHTYFVTHKQATGICLSYFNAGYSETQSYDKIDGVWTYNSQDLWTAE